MHWYYTPIGDLIGTLIIGFLSHLALEYIRHENFHFDVDEWMELLFNFMWATIFEALIFRIYDIQKQKNKRLHPISTWEEFE